MDDQKSEECVQEYESFIGSAYVAPIFKLVETLESGRGSPNEVQASVFEYGHSASVISLTILCLESFLNISKHLTGSHDRSVRAYFARNFPASAYQTQLVELFAVRDVVAHNHLWVGKIDPIQMKWLTLRLEPGYGDRAFNQVVDVSRRVTKKLGLNVVPTRLCYDDVRLVIRTVAAILVELREWHARQSPAYYLGTGGFGLTHYRGDFRTFLEAADLL